jgi:hypothetical protein
MDKNWLRERAYPMMKGAAEFYRNFPNLKKEADGKYHIHHTNNSESNWGGSDAPYEIACMHLIFPLAIRASEILGVDAELRPLWQEIKTNLIPERDTRRGSVIYGSFVYNGPGAIEPLGADAELKRRFLGFTRLGSFIDDKGIGGAQIFRNRLRLREGPGAIDAEHLGGLSFGIHSSLLASTPDTPEDEPVLQLFSDGSKGWPKDWEAAFTLLARGAFEVSSAIKGGQVAFVEVRSLVGSECRLRNPWGDAAVTLYREGKQAETLRGVLLKFSTRQGEQVVLAQPGKTLAQLKRTVL